ncbi:hypothetical protein [uncultured Anaerococcus sp.]|uniref:hypothetical protein n=1 Tax=uncultured Anaerococcus sp. TaxID=293428 RepID=UPI00288AC102|nr:hypothetical protein [uncultured Anaerococcus sp.]
MNKKFKVLAFAMSMAFVAPSVAMAADSKIDTKIKKLDKKITKLEDDYDTLNGIYQNVRAQSKAYTTKKGKLVFDEKAVKDKLFKIAIKLDEYVENTTPSMEQAMLGAYFVNGAKGQGYTIRPQSEEDLYNYLKGYFVMKDGKDKAKYEKLLKQYVKAIANSVVLPDLEDTVASTYDEVQDQKLKLEAAKAQRKDLLKQKKKLTDLEKAVSRAKITLEAGKKLIALAPEKIAGVRAELDKLMAEQEKLIKAGEKILNKNK